MNTRFQTNRIAIYFLIITVLLMGNSHADLFTIKSKINLRKGPGLNHPILQTLHHNQTLNESSRHGNWINVKAPNNENGFIREDMVSNIHIKVHKKERRLILLQGEKRLKSYKIALCPFNPEGDKDQQGDGGTPEGRFFLNEFIRQPTSPKYGARSMRISYPNVEDARRGLSQKLISHNTYLSIVKDIANGKMPDQTTPLGGSIRIHGGGNEKDWTLGCIALSDVDIRELFDKVQPGTRVEIYKSVQQEMKINQPGRLNRKILTGAKDQLKNPALYTSSACGIIRMPYPMGDIPIDQAVCTDIVIRALRNAGIDLQSLVHEDAVRFPKRYQRWIPKPNYHIDHRRTRNLQVYLTSHSWIQPLKNRRVRKETAKPGDIVIMDTGISNGTVFDHIGIIDDVLDADGDYQVINIWTTGHRTSSMDLIGNDYPEIVGHFRMSHPFDYQ